MNAGANNLCPLRVAGSRRPYIEGHNTLDGECPQSTIAHRCLADHSRPHYLALQVENPEYTSDALRHYPIGEDAKGSRFYYFSTNNEDCRLYREEPPKKGWKGKDNDPDAESVWQTQTTTLEELQDFADKLAVSRNIREKMLHEVLQMQILPKLIETANARKRAEEKAAMLATMPKKRSSRLQVLELKKEEDDKKQREREETDRRRQEERNREKERRRKVMEVDAPGLACHLLHFNGCTVTSIAW